MKEEELQRILHAMPHNNMGGNKKMLVYNHHGLPRLHPSFQHASVLLCDEFSCQTPKSTR